MVFFGVFIESVVFSGVLIESVVFLGVFIESVVFFGVFIESVVFFLRFYRVSARAWRHRAWRAPSGPARRPRGPGPSAGGCEPAPRSTKVSKGSRDVAGVFALVECGLYTSFPAGSPQDALKTVYKTFPTP